MKILRGLLKFIEPILYVIILGGLIFFIYQAYDLMNRIQNIHIIDIKNLSEKIKEQEVKLEIIETKISLLNSRIQSIKIK